VPVLGGDSWRLSDLTSPRGTKPSEVCGLPRGPGVSGDRAPLCYAIGIAEELHFTMARRGSALLCVPSRTIVLIPNAGGMCFGLHCFKTFPRWPHRGFAVRQVKESTAC
jgi:hypothetical protein